jgi:hypothetical protein
MRTIRGLLALTLVAAVAVALPATVLAQSAGDEQYTDPFQGQDNSGGGGGGGNNQSSGSGQTQSGGDVQSGGELDSGTTDSTSTGTDGSASTTAGATDSGSATLPVTGGPATMLAAIGAAFLLSGLALRRRA